MLRTAVILVISAALAGPVAAKGGGKGHGRDKDRKRDKVEVVKGHRHAHVAPGRRVVVARRVGPARVHTTRVVTVRRPAEVRRRGPAVVLFTERDRGLVRTYYRDTYRGGCPPGLAKKNNGCLPPGQARKRYVVGRPLPTTVVYESVPTVLVERLGPPPPGYTYVWVDGDVLKMALATRLVVDAVQFLVD